MGGTRIERLIRERFQAPRGIPWWVSWGAGAFATLIVVVSLVTGHSTLPLSVQLPLAFVTLLPWLPGFRQKWLSWSFVLMSMVPTLILTWTGGSPLLLGLLALSASRVAMSGTLPQGIAYGAGAAGIVIGR